jgi:hypothetical protein
MHEKYLPRSMSIASSEQPKAKYKNVSKPSLGHVKIGVMNCLYLDMYGPKHHVKAVQRAQCEE